MAGAEGILGGFRPQFTEEFNQETVLFGPAPKTFPREGRGLVGATLRISRKTYQVTGLKLRAGPALVPKGEMIGLVVRQIS